MFWKLNKKIDKLNQIMEEKNIEELIYLLGSKKEIFKRNFYAGIGRGVGILIFLLQKIVTLNIPVIGEYIAQIVEIVENKL